MGDTVIVVDTNQFRHSPMLRSAPWTELLARAEDWDLRFAVPEVCLLEAVTVVRRKWAEQRAVVSKLQVGEFDLAASQQEWLDAIDGKMATYEDALRARLEEIGADIVKVPDGVSLLDVAKRAVERRAPYPTGDGTKDGFRDTLIWCTTRGIAAADSDCEVWLVSENHNDFGDKSDVDKEACPFPLHQHLLDDLTAESLTGRVSYARTLGRLVQHLASAYDALPPAERDALIECVDRSDLTSNIEALLPGTPLNPSACALPVRTVTAAIRSITVDADELRLVDAARRGAGSWTAQYAQTIEADVDLADRDGDTSTLVKILNVNGRLQIGADGSVVDLLVTSIEAQPDDPMRRAWSQRNRDLIDYPGTGILASRYLENLGTANLTTSFLQNLDTSTATSKFLENLSTGKAMSEYLQNLGTANLTTNFLQNLDSRNISGEADNPADAEDCAHDDGTSEPTEPR